MSSNNEEKVEDNELSSDVDEDFQGRAALVDAEVSGEELLDDNLLARDYRAIPELDNYDEEQLDYNEYDHISYDAKRAADLELRKRDSERKKQFRSRRDRQYFFNDDSEEEIEHSVRRIRDDIDDSDNDDLLQNDNDDFMMNNVDEFDEDEYNLEEVVNLEDYKVPLTEFLALDRPRREIQRRFRNFLSDFRERGHRIYTERIQEMCRNNKQSLEINYVHLAHSKQQLAILLTMIKHLKKC